jgi:hypothetical protein
VAVNVATDGELQSDWRPAMGEWPSTEQLTASYNPIALGRAKASEQQESAQSRAVFTQERPPQKKKKKRNALALLEFGI